MEIHKFTVGQLNTNCYLVTDIETDRCIIIDPGDNADVISEAILSQDLEPIAMIATHGHFDHVLAAYELQLAFDIPFLIHPKDKNLLSRMASSAKYWLEKEIIEKPPGEVTEATSEDIVEFGKSQLQILHTPGHTPGGIVLFNAKENIIFTGDTIFKKGVGRTDLSYSSATLMKKSLKRIKSKFKGFEAYPGHGEIFYI